MTPEMLEALKEYLSNHLTVTVEAGEDWDDFGSSDSRRVKVRLELDGEVISEGSDSFCVGR